MIFHSKKYLEGEVSPWGAASGAPWKLRVLGNRGAGDPHPHPLVGSPLDKVVASPIVCCGGTTRERLEGPVKVDMLER